VNVRVIEGFHRPFAIQRDHNRNYLVCDFVNEPSVIVFDSDFSRLGYLSRTTLSPTLPAGAFKGPHAIDFDSHGYIYVTDYLARRVLKYTSTYDFIDSILDAESLMPHWLLSGPATTRIDSEGNLIVSDYGSHSLQKFSPDGRFVEWLGADKFKSTSHTWRTSGEPVTSHEPGGFDRLHDVGFDLEGNLLVVDTWNHRIQKFSRNGELLGVLGLKSNHTLTEKFEMNADIIETDESGGFSKPVAISLSGEFFVTSEFGNSRIQRFASDGKFLGWLGANEKGSPLETWSISGKSSAGSQPGCFNHPYDVRMLGHEIFVADSDNKRIQIIA
jgi:hypothetical protein